MRCRTLETLVTVTESKTIKFWNTKFVRAGHLGVAVGRLGVAVGRGRQLRCEADRGQLDRVLQRQDLH